jgi:hypothetical protein
MDLMDWMDELARSDGREPLDGMDFLEWMECWDGMGTIVRCESRGMGSRAVIRFRRDRGAKRAR